MAIKESSFAASGSATKSTVVASTKRDRERTLVRTSRGTVEAGSSSSDWMIVHSRQFRRAAASIASRSQESLLAFILSAAWVSAHASVLRGFPAGGGAE